MRGARRWRWESCTRSRPSRAPHPNPRPARTPPRARSWCRRRCGRVPRRACGRHAPRPAPGWRTSFAFVRLVEGELVAEGVGPGKVARFPRRILDAGFGVAIVLRRELGVIVDDAAHLDHHRRSGTGIAVMLAEMQK